MKVNAFVFTILLASFLSFVLSVYLWFSGVEGASAKDQGIFVGLWVPSILGLGNLMKDAMSKRS